MFDFLMISVSTWPLPAIQRIFLSVAGGLCVRLSALTNKMEVMTTGSEGFQSCRAGDCPHETCWFIGLASGNLQDTLLVGGSNHLEKY